MIAACDRCFSCSRHAGRCTRSPAGNRRRLPIPFPVPHLVPRLVPRLVPLLVPRLLLLLLLIPFPLLLPLLLLFLLPHLLPLPREPSRSASSPPTTALAPSTVRLR